MKTEHVFPTEQSAQEAWVELDRMGRQQNHQATVAFRVGCRVYLRPEFTSKGLMRELASLADALS